MEKSEVWSNDDFVKIVFESMIEGSVRGKPLVIGSIKEISTGERVGWRKTECAE